MSTDAPLAKPFNAARLALIEACPTARLLLLLFLPVNAVSGSEVSLLGYLRGEWLRRRRWRFPCFLRGTSNASTSSSVVLVFVTLFFLFVFVFFSTLFLFSSREVLVCEPSSSSSVSRLLVPFEVENILPTSFCWLWTPSVENGYSRWSSRVNPVGPVAGALGAGADAQPW